MLQESLIPLFFSPPSDELMSTIDDSGVIGFHWYAGSPLAQEFENQLNLENIDQFDNFLTRIIKLKEYNICQ